MSETIVSVNDNNFGAEVLESEIPVIVDFWAEWCGPCRMFAPIFHEVSEEYVGKIKFVKANVDENQQAAQEYGVRGIPTIMMFNAKEVVATQVGLLAKTQLKEFLDSNS